MKMIKFLLFIVCISICISCSTPGESKIALTGNEKDLPKELQGLKVYKVQTNTYADIFVASLNDKFVNTSWEYSSGKTTHHSSLIVLPNDSLIKIKEIISENDSILVIKKY